MNNYSIARIYHSDKRSMAEVKALLYREGIRMDSHLDYTVGLYDAELELIGTGSCYANTLRCLAISSAHRSEGLMNTIVTELITHQSDMGNTHVFIYTKPDKARIFASMGFFEVACTQKAVLLENTASGFDNYLASLSGNKADCAAVVINANPFTLGHLHLVETAAKSYKLLHLFIVSEDMSLIPYAVRERLVKKGTAHIRNIVYHGTGNYLISSASFPSYFLKEDDSVIEVQAELDCAIFIKIAAHLGIAARFVGEEPNSIVTALYNDTLAAVLPGHGIACRIIPRLAVNEHAVSASYVRECIKTGNIESIRSLVPETTYRYFVSPEAVPVIEHIQHCDNVKHY